MKIRLDKELFRLGLVPTRSQAESYIKLGYVTVNKKSVTKPGSLVSESDDIKLTAKEQYVSRAGLKLASVTNTLKLNFKDKVMLDVGSSTGGFTDYALQHGAKRVIAVELGTDQLHPKLRQDKRVELHEKTDIRRYIPSEHIDITVMDVSFISLREILPHISKITDKETQIVAMVKPQFEAEKSAYSHKGVIKNDAMRRTILKDFEAWAQKLFIILDKADSEVAGSKGNRERFYLLSNL
ncbi:TlyA family RNA methyltransferase [Candidatus Saccharibacteria bacterium]|nr:TlyA family RNA methyltransferase [Candidatus Saccharibacteria bacterium]